MKYVHVTNTNLETRLPIKNALIIIIIHIDDYSSQAMKKLSHLAPWSKKCSNFPPQKVLEKSTNRGSGWHPLGAWYLGHYTSFGYATTEMSI